MKRIVFYTRGGEGYGTGHLYRTSWLIESLRELESASVERPISVKCFDCQETRAFWSLRDADVEFFSTDPLLDLVVPPPPDDDCVVVVDWLDTHPELLRQLHSRAARLVLLDDYGPGQAEADLVINSLLTPLEADAQEVGSCIILSGARYVALAPELRRLHTAATRATRSLEQLLADAVIAELRPLRAVMVNFGGGIIRDAIKLALDALAAEGFDGRVIVMPADSAVEVPRELDVVLLGAGEEFHDLLAACDLCICAGGLAVFEAAMLGVPALAIAVIPHQLPTLMKLSTAGTCMFAGPLHGLTTESLRYSLSALLGDEKLRAIMSARGQQVVDGYGSTRVALEILQFAQ